MMIISPVLPTFPCSFKAMGPHCFHYLQKTKFKIAVRFMVYETNEESSVENSAFLS